MHARDRSNSDGPGFVGSATSREKTSPDRDNPANGVATPAQLSPREDSEEPSLA